MPCGHTAVVTRAFDFTSEWWLLISPPSVLTSQIPNDCNDKYNNVEDLQKSPRIQPSTSDDSRFPACPHVSIVHTLALLRAPAEKLSRLSKWAISFLSEPLNACHPGVLCTPSLANRIYRLVLPNSTTSNVMVYFACRQGMLSRSCPAGTALSSGLDEIGPAAVHMVFYFSKPAPLLPPSLTILSSKLYLLLLPI